MEAFTREELVHIRACVDKLHQDSIFGEGGDLSDLCEKLADEIRDFSAPANAAGLGEQGISDLLDKLEDVLYGDQITLVRQLENDLWSMLPTTEFRVTRIIVEDIPIIRVDFRDDLLRRQGGREPVRYTAHIVVHERSVILTYDGGQMKYDISNPSFPDNFFHAVKQALKKRQLGDKCHAKEV